METLITTLLMILIMEEMSNSITQTIHLARVGGNIYSLSLLMYSHILKRD